MKYVVVTSDTWVSRYSKPMPKEKAEALKAQIEAEGLWPSVYIDEHPNFFERLLIDAGRPVLNLHFVLWAVINIIFWGGLLWILLFGGAPWGT